MGYAIIAFVALLALGLLGRVVNRRLVWLRGVLGGFGSLFYFLAITNTRLSNATVLFYTYPIFVGFISRWMQGAALSPPVVGTLAASFVGIYLIVRPSFETVLIGDGFGLLAGLTAAGAITSLKASRKTDSGSDGSIAKSADFGTPVLRISGRVRRCT